MINTKKPRKCGVCGKKRKVYGFSHARKKTFSVVDKGNNESSVYINMILEGKPRLCRQCTGDMLAALTISIRSVLQRKMIDEKTQIYTL